jgi:hypothetical protein
MAYNQLTSLDYFEIKNALRDYLRANSDFSDYDFEGSTLGTLLDVLAYNTYYTSFNANMSVNETFLDSATLRDNVVARAKELGYTPRSAVAASAAVTLNVTLSGVTLPQSVFLKRGNAFITNVNDTVYQYVLLDDVQANVLPDNSVNVPDIKIYEGLYISNNYTVPAYTGSYSILLQNQNIDTSSIRINVYESSNSSSFEKFVQSDNILNVGASSPTYFVTEVEDENYKITFGDGIFGKKLVAGQVIEISYLTTNADETNGASVFTYNGLITDVAGGSSFNVAVNSVTTLTKAFGGAGVESIESIKMNAPASFGAQNRAVTTLDYEAIVRKIYPAISDIISYGGEEDNPPEFGKVKVAIKPRELSFLSSYTKNLILQEIKKYAVAAVTPEIVDPSIIFVELNSRVYYDQSSTNLNSNQLKERVVTNLAKYVQLSDTEKFGGKFRYSKAISTIDASDKSIRSNLTNIIMRKDFYPALNSSAYYEFCLSNSFDDDIDTQTLVSTGFVVQQYPNFIVYLEDRGSKVVLYRLDSQTGDKIVLNSEQGEIDYVKGDVRLYNLNIIKGSFSDNKIEIRLKPQYNDIVAKRQIYLDVDIEKSSFTLIQE